LTAREAAYGTYHVVTSFILAAGIGWWREFVLRKEFAARSALDDSRRAAEQRALRLAHYDEVTGLPNQRLFSDLATPILARTVRGGTRCAVLHVQIDGLGNVHDVYGRALGEVMLAGIAARLRASIRGSDVAVARPAGDAPGVLARHGDSAFSILVGDLDGQERASLVAQRLLAAVAQPVLVDGRPLVLSASIGVAVCPGDGTDLAGLAHCAEQAAHAALRSGGAQHRFFDEALNTRARERVQLESELRHAIAAGQLRLHFQPKVDAGNPGAPLVGAEALVRWQHPRRGLLAPGQFIGLAEECGLIVPLTDWVLQTACQSLRRWADAGLPPLPLSVNLAAPSLADPGLVDRLDTLMQQHRLQPSSLVLELTESMLIHDAAATIGVLQRLRTHGFALSLDDFGTGYSSLAYLRHMPIDELKIDRAFITDAARGGRDGALAATIITLGSELGLRVVAEGVETAAQSAFLLARGCTLQQGYLFSRPVPEERFVQLLRAGTTCRTADAPVATDAHHAIAA
jgi:diguanylate cyclase (GGDEF)-like protein